MNNKKAIIIGLVLFLCAVYVGNAQNSIRGYIFDQNAKPCQGATVQLSQTMGTISNDMGMFVLKGIESSLVQLEISSLGFASQVLTINLDTLSIDVIIQLEPLQQAIDEIEVIEDANQNIKKTASVCVQLIDEAFYKEARASSLMQTLNKVPGINSMDVGTGISKPMIRGMGFYRVVVAQNGIKHEGQQWSNHHGLSIDQHAVDHVEIIKGPACLQYGSDAMGGVINILPHQAPLSEGVEGEFSLTAKSNSLWLGTSADVSVRKGDVYLQSALSYSTYGDFLIPATDSFLLPSPVSAAEASHPVTLGNQMYNTAGNEKAFSTGLGIMKSWGNSYLEFSLYNTESGFFDWQGMQNDSTRSLHIEKRRDRQLPYLNLSNYAVHHYTNRYFNSGKFELALAYQVNDSKEFSLLSNRSGNRTEERLYYRSKGNLDLGLKLQTISGNAIYKHEPNKKQEIKVGLNSQYQWHTTDGYNHILPEYKKASAGVFITQQYKFSKKWIVNSGIRTDLVKMKLEESLNPDLSFGDSIFNPALDKLFPGLAFSIGCNFNPSANTIIKLNIGKSFRFPSAYELGAYGLHRHQGRFEKGNTTNNTEKAWQFDFGMERKWSNFNLQLSPFVNYFSNYLYLNPTSTLRPEGQVYEYIQSKAMLSGTEFTAQYTFINTLEMNVGAEYVYAVNLDLNSALPFTPPLTIKTSLDYLINDYKILKNNKVGVELVSVASQNYTVQNELNTPGYHVLNLLAITEFDFGKHKVNLMLKVRNLLNTAYFNHTSFYRRLRIPEPGRDVQLYVSLPF